MHVLVFLKSTFNNKKKIKLPMPIFYIKCNIFYLVLAFLLLFLI